MLGWLVLVSCLETASGAWPASPPTARLAPQDPKAATAATPSPSTEAERPIQDNSFLIEEAYNQEPGVVQHISTLQRDLRGNNWGYSFTQEWPVPGVRHQLSVTLPVQNVEASADGGVGVGDIALNYRYQLVGSGDSKVAVAPRFSLIAGTGDERQYRGSGALGYQVNLPISIVLNQAFVTHINAGATVVPKARNASGDSATAASFSVGQSLVWLARPTFNGLVEVIYSRGQVVSGPSATETVDSLLVSPGVRWAINCRSGLQIVPGFAVPIGVGPSAGQRAVFFYLSFEHPMFSPRQ
jgi:hypothetical protein